MRRPSFCFNEPGSIRCTGPQAQCPWTHGQAPSLKFRRGSCRCRRCQGGGGPQSHLPDTQEMCLRSMGLQVPEARCPVGLGLLLISRSQGLWGNRTEGNETVGTRRRVVGGLGGEPHVSWAPTPSL